MLKIVRGVLREGFDYIIGELYIIQLCYEMFIFFIIKRFPFGYSMVWRSFVFKGLNEKAVTFSMAMGGGFF